MMKSEMIEHIANECDVPISVATKMLKAFEKATINTLKNGGVVHIVNFIKLTPYKTKARMGIDPRDKTPIKIKSRIAIKFSAGIGLKNALN